MNVEVLRLRAAPGGDAGALARFAAAAAAEQTAVAEMAGALLALVRAPRPGPADVAEACAHVARLVGPAARHEGVRLELALGDAPARTAAPAAAVRLGVCLALEAACAGVTATPAGNTAGPAAADRSGAVRCTVLAGDEPALVVAPAPAGWPGEAAAELADAGVRVERDGDGVRLTFPAP